MTAPLNTIENFTNICKAASDPLRVMILRVLLCNSFSVLELTRLFNTTQPGMSHHLKLLLQSGLVLTRREGNTIFYRRTIPSEHILTTFHQYLFDEIDSLALPETVLESLNEIYAERGQLSQLFFSQLAQSGTLGRQDIIVDISHYQKNIEAIIDSKAFSKDALVLEIGPGDGRLLPVLSKRFKQVLAMDNSMAMLNLAKHYCQQQQLTNIVFIEADAARLKVPELLDCMVSNMVLHHLPAPAEAFKYFRHCLKEDGVLVLTELCHHEQSWVMETCGDLWLGFEPDELNHWAKSTGFLAEESVYLGLRNGFQLQIRCFRAI